MILRKLEVKNFRGIKECNLVFPSDSRIVCLIGAGDNTKSTLLNAVEWIVYPAWNLQACDSDFYNCNINEPIVLRGTFAELPEKLLQEDKFGLYLRRPDVEINREKDDEPIDGEALCLTIQLTISSSLEPKWEVVCNRQEPKTISQNDRRLLTVANVGHDCGKDMVWGRYSVLQRYAEINGALNNVYTDALRKAAEEADFSALDDIGNVLKRVGQHYGVDFSADIKNKLMVQNKAYSTFIGVFDGNIPLNQRGTGSQRLLSMGLNIGAFQGNTLLLVDEIESGLEPYRLRNLINEFRITHSEDGQVIMTTHSPVAVSECTIDEIMVIRSKDGKTEGFYLRGTDADVNNKMQAEVRKNAEAFLSKRVVVCEGKTEQGFLRALDTYLVKILNVHMAYKGVGNADGGGQSIFDCAERFISCGYDICLFMDSDKPEDEETKTKLREAGIKIFDWDSPNCIEEQIFQDVPLEVAEKLLPIAVEEKGMDSVVNRLKLNPEILYTINDGMIKLMSMERTAQRCIGSVAGNKKCAWYKRISQGERVGNVIFENWNVIEQETKLHRLVEALTAWVIRDD